MAENTGKGASSGKGSEGIGLAVGTKIGKYEIVERTAIGGQSVVYKAHDPLLDRHVAIKQISTHLAEDPKFLERFRKEAQILAKLGEEQPAIVTIHEMIEQEQGLFIVMEYVAGHSMETILVDTKGPIELKAALQVLFRLAAALHDVHAAGVIHRDIKPSNIIIGEGLRPTITDFGVAAGATGQTSMVLGTTKYMAPELFEGGDVDGRADIYSLGVIAYEMLAGREKFNEIFADIVRDPHSQALRWMKWHGNPDLTAPAINEVNPAVPAALSDIVDQMMAKDLNERFSTMEELGRAIKVAFSPRGRGKAVAGAPKWRRRGAAAEALDEKADLEAHDGADELEVQADETPTSRVPRKSLSLKTVLIVVGVLFVVALSGVIWLVIDGNMAQARRARDARQAFKGCETQFEQNKLPEAIESLKQLRKDYRGTAESAKASVMIFLYQAHLAMAQADTNNSWQVEAAEALKKAENQLKEVQRRRGDLEEWVVAMDRKINTLDKEKDKTRTFRQAMRNARLALQQEEYEKARGFLDATDVEFTNAQQSSVQAFRKKIDLQEFWGVYNGHVDAGDTLAADARKAGNLDTFARADAAYQKAAQWLASPKSDPLDAEQRKGLAGKLAVRRKTLAGARDYQAAVIAADTARKDGERDNELTQLQIAYRIKPTPVVAKRIGGIRSDIAFEEGSRALDDKDYAQAQRLFKVAIGHNPDNARAKEALANLQRGGRRRQLIGTGNRALTAGDHKKALDAFQKAAGIEPSDELKTKIIECRFQIELAEARALRKTAESHRPPVAGEYDKAVAAYEEARGVKSSEAEMVAAEVATMKRRQDYEEWVAKANAAEAKSRWQTMLEAWTEAKNLRPVREAAEGIARAMYGDYLAKGKDAVAVEDFRGALGWFGLAKGQVSKAGISPEEVDVLIAKVKQKLGN